MKWKALIFDVDGTLSETEEAHRQAFNETFAEQGLDWFWSAALYEKLLKTTGGKERMAVYQRDHLDSERLSQADIAELHRRKTDRYNAILSAGGLSARPGVMELIARARTEGLRLAIATTTNLPNVEGLARALWKRPATEVFDVIAAGDEVRAKKPAPDVFQLALERLNLPAQDCLAFEDSRNGLHSALAAGLETIITPSRYTAGEDFTGASQVLDSLVDFQLA